MFVWDEPKRQANLARHGLDFADLDEWFFLDAVTVPAKENRYMAIGRMNEGTIAVVFTNSDASLMVQLYSIVVVGAFVVVTSGLGWLILKAVMGIRVAAEDERNGLDMSEMGMEAYPEFSKG